MTHPNSVNTQKGKDFQQVVRGALEKHFGKAFELEKSYPIGNPAKDHKFDLVSVCGQIVAKTKNYSWTESGNVPSAKMSMMNEAVFYLQHCPLEVETKLIVMRLDRNIKKNETLAEYYVSKYRHLLKDVLVMEYDPDTDLLKTVS